MRPIAACSSLGAYCVSCSSVGSDQPTRRLEHDGNAVGLDLDVGVTAAGDEPLKAQRLQVSRIITREHVFKKLPY
jgi:hypothetical protein